MKVLSKLTLSFLILCCLLTGFSFQVQAQMIGGTVGSTAPNIELPDQYGNKISLNGLRGNLVLVRFWKSGDPNSRASNMNIYALHDKYKNASFKTAKGFEVFTVSLDSRLDKWKMALQQDQLPQNYHVNDIYSKYVAPYGVKVLPTNFLLDENGVIVANTKSMAELDQELSRRANVYGTTTTTVIPNNVVTTPTITSDMVNTSDRPTPSTFNQPTTTTIVEAGTTYMIQLGAYKNWDMNKFLNASEYGFVTAEDAGNGIKRALLGKFDTKEDLVSTLSKVRENGYPDAFAVEYTNNIRRVMPSKDISTLATSMGIRLANAPASVPSKTNTSPSTMSVATTTDPSSTEVSSSSSASSGYYEMPFSNINTDNSPITSIPDASISHTYHNGGGSVITSNTTTSTGSTGNVATFNSGSTVTSTSTLVPSEIPVFTGGVTPSTNSQGTFYDSDSYELSWYPSEPAGEPNIIQSPYYNTLPSSQNPNTTNMPNYDNNNSGWSDWKPVDGGNTNNNGWNNNNSNTTTSPSWNSTNNNANTNNGSWSDWQPVDNNNNTNNGWNNNSTQQPNNTNNEWNNAQPDSNTYPQPNNQELEQSLNSYLDGYDFSSVDENSDNLSKSKKKKNKKKKKKKKKR